VKWAVALLLSSTLALAQPEPPPTTLRIATIAPDGTTWARELKSWASDVERVTAGAVHIKLYFSAIAGDEPEMAERIRRGQLDGMIGSMYCNVAGPSLRVMLVVGLLQDREETSWLLNRLRPRLDKEFLEHGFVNLGELGLGSLIVFSRKPIASMADLQSTKLLVWARDELLSGQLPHIGIHPVLETLEHGAKAYTDGRTDGFIAPPAAALAFQWSSLAKYFTDLHINSVVGCGMISARSFDALPVPAQVALRDASARMIKRYEQIAREQDDALLGGVFQKQGLKRIPVDEKFRFDFFEAARNAREQLALATASPELLREVITLLGDYRASHR
jgi:TRAP-type C4-dicarboxylate transport system substrate-binding protein